MVSQDDNCSNSRETQGEPSHASRTPGDRGDKLLVDAQRMVKVALKQRLGRLLLEGEDCRYLIIKHLQAQMVEMTEIMVENWVMKPPL